jgi:nitronate monooxygenase
MAPGPRGALDELLAGLGVELPVLAAPMAGGPGTPELVIAAARAGSLGFLAAGYKAPAALAGEIAAVRAAGTPFGVNLFAPNPLPVDRAAFARYAEELRPEAESVGAELDTGAPREDDDSWSEKVELLVADAPPLVSFTFGLPPDRDLAALRSAGAALVAGVTSPAEAAAAARAGVDALVVQSAEAGGHWGTFTPASPPPPMPLSELLAAVAERTSLPMLAAGGIATASAVSQALAGGAEAVLVGTALLRADEAGTTTVHRDALADPARAGTTVTRSFTGRPARGLRNGFIERHEQSAPLGYPAIHHLTSPMRRAAAAKGEAELVHLWAGTGFRDAPAQPAGTILRALSEA